jgi:antirestriction protein ArdC
MDLYQDVTNKIVASLEAGTPPWIRPWSTGDSGLPVNGATQRPYAGINVVLLTLESMVQGYDRNTWLTYRQAAALGAQVRAGEHGATVVFYKQLEFPDKDDPTKPGKVVPLLRSFTVFNADQIDNLPPHLTQPAPPPTWDPLDAADRLLMASGATIHHKGNKAFYHPPLDYIVLPPRTSFPSAPAYYSTGLHELSHWSGAPSRLNRDLSGRFKEAAYAAEELVAEMSSAFLCAQIGIEGGLQHASYAASWLRLLRSDKRAVFTAAAKAQQAATYILETAGVMPGAPVEAVAA